MREKLIAQPSEEDPTGFSPTQKGHIMFNQISMSLASIAAVILVSIATTSALSQMTYLV